MTLSKKRDSKSIGGTLGIDRSVPTLTHARDSIINVERGLQVLLESETNRFKDDENLLRMFFGYYFKGLVDPAEIDEFVKNFVTSPPEIVLGYPRSSTTFPCMSIILESEDEQEPVLADYAGETDTDDPDDVREANGDFLEHEGGFWKSVYGVYVYAQHPDVCLYLYHFAKMILVSGRIWLLSQGLNDVGLSGGELAPDERYLPDNMFIRMVRVMCTAPQTVPRFALVDPRRLRTYGLFMEDVVVDGVPGGVHPIPPPSPPIPSDVDEEELPDE